jgi:enamine deaminase RidA (YjgF/YER057c/UK114 family)
MKSKMNEHILKNAIVRSAKRSCIRNYRMKCGLTIVFLLVVLICCQGCKSVPLISGQSGEKTVNVRLSELGIILPNVSTPVAAYVNVVESGDLIFVSGQLPVRDGKVVYTGKVGRDIEPARAQEAARLCAINALAALKAQLGSLGKVRRIVRLEVFVNSAAGFTGQSQVANGASLLLQQVFGDVGKHTRMAVGVAELPLNAAVEVAMIVERK